MLFHEIPWSTIFKFKNVLPKISLCSCFYEASTCVCPGAHMHGQRQRMCRKLSGFLLVVGYSWFLNFLEVLNLIQPKITPSYLYVADHTVAFFLRMIYHQLASSRRQLLPLSQWKVGKQVWSERHGELRTVTHRPQSHCAASPFPCGVSSSLSPALSLQLIQRLESSYWISTITWEAISWPSPQTDWSSFIVSIFFYWSIFDLVSC